MLSTQKLDTALLVAQDRLTNAQIAAKMGISLRCLDKWKADAEFQTEVERCLNRWREDIEKRGIADRRRRLYRLNDRARRMEYVIRARAKLFRQMARKAAKEAAASGKELDINPFLEGTAGVSVIKPTRYGDVIEVDTALLAEMRATEQQISIELGQWKPKHVITGEDDGPIQLAVAKLSELFTLEELQAMQERLLAKAAGETKPA